MKLDILALIAVVVGVVLCVLTILFALIAPKAALVVVERVSIKLLLIVVAASLLVVIGLLLRSYYDVPSKQHLVLRTIKFFMCIAVPSGGTPLGVFAIESARGAVQTGQTRAWFDVRFVAPSSSLGIFVVCAVIIYKLLSTTTLQKLK